MVVTRSEVLDAGWRLHVRCAWGRREGLKWIRECKGRLDADVLTLVWTRVRGLSDRSAGTAAELTALRHPPRAGGLPSASRAGEGGVASVEVN